MILVVLMVMILKSLQEIIHDRPLIFIGHSFGGNVIEQACHYLPLRNVVAD